MPVDLATFRLSLWLALVDRNARLPADDGRSCSDEYYRREEARRLWVRARTVWADRHEWPGGLLAKLTEERDVRRALAAAARVEPGTTRRADPMPTWTFTDHAGRVEADRIEDDGTGWS